MPGNSEQPKDPQWDELDLQIIAIKKDHPSITIRELAEQLDSKPTTIWRHLQKIGTSNWVLEARNECQALLPLAISIYARRMRNPDSEEAYVAARDLLHGLGVLRKRHELSGPDGGPIRTASAVVILPDNGTSPDSNCGAAATTGDVQGE